jgi:hypothetical protein
MDLLLVISWFTGIIFVTMTGYGDGITDSGINKPGFHLGTYWGPWHIWSRLQSIFSFLTGVSFAVMIFIDYRLALWSALPGLVLFFLGFRAAVYRNGKYELWYPNEKGIKRLLSRLLITIISRFSS